MKKSSETKHEKQRNNEDSFHEMLNEIRRQSDENRKEREGIRKNERTYKMWILIEKVLELVHDNWDKFP